MYLLCFHDVVLLHIKQGYNTSYLLCKYLEYGARFVACLAELAARDM